MDGDLLTGPRVADLKVGFLRFEKAGFQKFRLSGGIYGRGVSLESPDDVAARIPLHFRFVEAAPFRQAGEGFVFGEVGVAFGVGIDAAGEEGVAEVDELDA